MSAAPHLLVLSIATNRYWDFIPRLHASFMAHWTAVDVPVRFLVLTNRSDARPTTEATIIRPIAHRPWPHMTLGRYRAFLAHRDLLAQAAWIVYLDADMLVVGDLGRHFLCPSFTTCHPGYSDPRTSKALPFERRPASSACIREPEPSVYFYGGVQGGEASDFITMCERIAEAIDADSGAGITALWHDESHLNAYRQRQPPATVLPPAFAYPDLPEQAAAWGIAEISPKILALTKDHLAYRYGPFMRWFIRARTWAVSSARRIGLRRGGGT